MNVHFARAYSSGTGCRGRYSRPATQTKSPLHSAGIIIFLFTVSIIGLFASDTWVVLPVRAAVSTRCPEYCGLLLNISNSCAAAGYPFISWKAAAPGIKIGSFKECVDDCDFTSLAGQVNNGHWFTGSVADHLNCLRTYSPSDQQACFTGGFWEKCLDQIPAMHGYSAVVAMIALVLSLTVVIFSLASGVVFQGDEAIVPQCIAIVAASDAVAGATSQSVVISWVSSGSLADLPGVRDENGYVNGLTIMGMALFASSFWSCALAFALRQMVIQGESASQIGARYRRKFHIITWTCTVIMMVISWILGLTVSGLAMVSLLLLIAVIVVILVSVWFGSALRHVMRSFKFVARVALSPEMRDRVSISGTDNQSRNNTAPQTPGVTRARSASSGERLSSRKQKMASIALPFLLYPGALIATTPIGLILWLSNLGENSNPERWVAGQAMLHASAIFNAFIFFWRFSKRTRFFADKDARLRFRKWCCCFRSCVPAKGSTKTSFTMDTIAAERSASGKNVHRISMTSNQTPGRQARAIELEDVDEEMTIFEEAKEELDNNDNNDAASAVNAS